MVEGDGVGRERRTAKNNKEGEGRAMGHKRQSWVEERGTGCDRHLCPQPPVWGLQYKSALS